MGGHLQHERQDLGGDADANELEVGVARGEDGVAAGGPGARAESVALPR